MLLIENYKEKVKYIHIKQQNSEVLHKKWQQLFTNTTYFHFRRNFFIVLLKGKFGSKFFQGKY